MEVAVMFGIAALSFATGLSWLRSLKRKWKRDGTEFKHGRRRYFALWFPYFFLIAGATALLALTIATVITRAR